VGHARGYTGSAGVRRPGFPIEPAPGQESVWDYPRPLQLAPDHREVVIIAAGTEVARTGRAMCVLPQPGQFYARWAAPDVFGPFKGEPGFGVW
jgi:hypothetical protein